MSEHKKDSPNPERFKMMDSSRRLMSDKLEGLNTIKYKLLNKTRNYLFTHILVYYNKTEIVTI